MRIKGRILLLNLGIKYRKNECFLDVVESLNLLVNASGTVLRSVERINQTESPSWNARIKVKVCQFHRFSYHSCCEEMIRNPVSTVLVRILG